MNLFSCKQRNGLANNRHRNKEILPRSSIISRDAHTKSQDPRLDHREMCQSFIKNAKVETVCHYLLSMRKFNLSIKNIGSKKNRRSYYFLRLSVQCPKYEPMLKKLTSRWRKFRVAFASETFPITKIREESSQSDNIRSRS